MSTLVLKGLSPELHAELKARAKAHRRSLNQEAIGLLERAVEPYKVPYFEPIKPLTHDA